MSLYPEPRDDAFCLELNFNISKVGYFVTNTFLLVSSSVRSKQLLCFVHGQGQKREQKPTTKKFVGFHNHSSLLTMVKPSPNL